MAPSVFPSPVPSPTRQKKAGPQLGTLVSIQNKTICYDRKKNSLNDEENESTVVEFESALKEMNVSDLSEPEQTLLINNYNNCYRQLKCNNKKGINRETEPDLNQIMGIVNDWAPKTDLICLYVRWARKLPLNFNLDSIATLLTVAKQCGYSVIGFLNIHALQVCPAKGKNKKPGRYGVTFIFVSTLKEKDQFTHQFTGFLVTLKLLESSVVGSRAVNGKVGMRQSTPRLPSEMLLTTGDDNEKTVVNGTASTEFHKPTSLRRRVWSNINHRWLAFRVIQYLSKETSAEPMEDQAALQYSFQMNAEAGRGRYDWLDSIVGVCLRFSSFKSITSNKTELAKVWLDARSFYSLGTTELRNISDKAMYNEIAATFRELQLFSRPITYERRCKEQWLLLRGYAFNLWLDATKNKRLKMDLTETFGTSTTKKKKRSQSTDVANTGLPPKDGNKRARLEQYNDPSSNPLFIEEIDLLVNRRAAANDNTITSGLDSLLASRQDLVTPANSKDDHDVAVLETDKQSNMTTITPQLFSKEALIQDYNWSSFRLVCHDELDQLVASYLIIRTKDNGDLLSKLSPLEVYSADSLGKHLHSRVSGSPATDPTKLTKASRVTIIGSAAPCVTDPTGLYHVAREGSCYFLEHGSLLVSTEPMSHLCKAVLKYGKVDGSRSPGQFRINIGCGGQHRPDGVPAKLVGLDFVNSMAKDESFNSDSMLRSIGSLTEFLWKTMVGLQRDAKGSPLAPDRQRHELYASFLCKQLSMDNCVGIEDVTLVVSILYPHFDGVSEHVDQMNDSFMGYTRTGTLNMCFKLDDIIIHFQVIANFRKVIRQYTIPFYSGLESTKNHIDEYLQKWQDDINQKFAGRTDHPPTPFDRSPFFLDDCLEFKRLEISPGIAGDYLLTVINPSRVLSFSMFIDPLVELKGELCFDQRLELGFVCSLLNNPFLFHKTMTLLTVRHRDDEDCFQFGIHPFYDWASCTLETFESWQGGIHNRWSPCGGQTDMLKTFGAQLGASTVERLAGESKLTDIVELLYRHLCWVDSLQGRGDNPTDELPLASITDQLHSVCSQVNDIASCQLGAFRLSMFTTVHTGCGDLKPGRHLRQLMFPVKGCASYKHLACPSGDYMSTKRAAELGSSEPGTTVANDGDDRIITEYHDRAMRLLSVALGRPHYFRDEMECLLCESMHGRNLLSCCDWFCQGQSIYDIDDFGYIVVRSYGAGSKWKKMEVSPSTTFAFLVPTITYVRQDDTLMCIADRLGRELRNSNKVMFNGRKGSVEHYTNAMATEVSLMPHQYLGANFYCGTRAQSMKLQNMHVLASAEYPKDLARCNDLQEYGGGRSLLNHCDRILRSTVSLDMLGACYHKGGDESSGQITYYQGHVDKAFVCCARFIPLGVPFFTFVSFPTAWHFEQDEGSLASYKSWILTLDDRDRNKLENFATAFKEDAKKPMKNVDCQMYIFENKLGSLLAFPTNICYHTTVTPPSKEPRDLLIVHPLFGDQTGPINV